MLLSYCNITTFIDVLKVSGATVVISIYLNFVFVQPVFTYNPGSFIIENYLHVTSH